MKIVQFTDIHHYNDDSEPDRKGIQLINRILDRVKPDLVVLSGDILDGPHPVNNAEALKNITKPMVERSIKWAYVPGNHDDENEFYTRDDLLKTMLNEPFCIYPKNSKSFDLSILMDEVQLYFLDSNAYAPNTSSQKVLYDWIHDDQIEWYKNEKSEGQIGLAFFHIPVPEYKQVKILKGVQGEVPCSPEHNSGFYNASKLKGDIQAMFVGHDHLNDFVGELDNQWLCYGRVSGFTEPTYYSQEIHLTSHKRGARVIEYNQDTRELSTWIETEDDIVMDSMVSKVFDRKIRNMDISNDI